jgi:hypothetical protein
MINVDASIETVICAKGKFEVHLEAYYPRIFVTTSKHDDDGLHIKHYEILRDGQALVWPGLPDACGFDFWHFTVNELRDFKMTRS